MQDYFWHTARSDAEVDEDWHEVELVLIMILL